jgi:hypothetical protein
VGIVTLPHLSKTDSDPNLFSDVKANDQAIINEVNGGLDAENLDSNAVTTAKITDANVTAAKFSSTALFDAGVTAAPISTTGNTTVSNTSVTNIPSTSAMKAGMPISGPLVLPGTTIASVDSATAITMSTQATATATGTALTVLASGIQPPINSVYRTITSADALAGWDRAAGTYLLSTTANFAGLVLSGEDLSSGAPIPQLLYFDDADHAVPGLTRKLRVRAQVLPNATAPGIITYTVGLHNVSASAGGADVKSYTLAAAVSGSTVAFVNPTASTPAQNVSGDFAVPADGYYVLGVVTSAAVANNSAVHISAQLQVRNV